jgi:hypothetical protein
VGIVGVDAQDTSAGTNDLDWGLQCWQGQRALDPGQAMAAEPGELGLHNGTEDNASGKR